MGIEKELEELWKREYEQLWQKHAKLSTRRFPPDEIVKFPMIIVHNALRDYWESIKAKQAKEREKSDNKICSLDTETVTYIPYNDLLFKFNQNPTLKYHLFAKTSEHREHPFARDHLTIMELVNETDYAIYLNLRGSGAGLPDHLHYQGQKRRHFPLSSLKLESEILAENDRFELRRPELVNYGLVFETKSKQSRETVSQILGHLHGILYKNGLPYNLLFDKEEVYIFPRTAEIASNIPDELKKAGMERWQIAGQEMGHLFTAKYYQILEKMTKRILLDTLKDVTLFELREQEEFEKMVLKVI